MTLPEGWTPVDLSPARPVPQTAPLPGAPAGTRVALVATPTDLARLLDTPPGQLVHVAPHVAPADGRGAARRDVTDSVATGATPVHLVVVASGRVLSAWPLVARRALPVTADDELLGHLWVQEVALAAGTLVQGGHHDSRVVVGWRTLAALAATDPDVGRPHRARPEPEGDPHDRLV